MGSLHLPCCLLFFWRLTLTSVAVTLEEGSWAPALQEQVTQAGPVWDDSCVLGPISTAPRLP